MNCCLCHSKDVLFTESFHEYEMLKCSGCGLEFSNPMKAGNSEYYAAVTEYGEKWEFLKVPSWLEEKGISGELLDLGCGDGRFLAEARSKFSVTGLDFNPLAIKTARTEHGLKNIHDTTLDNFKNSHPDIRFNVICAFHILEHLDHPIKFLSEIKAMLKSGGVAAIAVPNPGRWALAFGRENWDYPPHHLTRWNEKSLKLVLEQAGLKAVDIFYEPIVSFQQVKSGFEDIVWAKVLKSFSFGVASKLSSQGLGKAKVKTHRFRDFLVASKTFVIRMVILIMTAVYFPFLVCAKKQGKTLLIFSRAV